MNVRAKNISPLRVPTISIRPTIKHERTTNRGARPNVTTHRIRRGEKYFARPCAIDAPSPPRYDRAPAMRRRTMDVRAKYFSPGLAPSVRNRPTIQHRHAMNRGARRNLPPHHGCTGEIYFAPTCAFDVRSTAVRPGVRVGCLTAPPRRRGARLNARHRALQPGVCSTNCNLAPMQQQCRAWNASLPTPAHPAAPSQTKPSTRSCL